MAVTAAPGEAFWRAALKLYDKPGAQEALLRIQDESGGDVMALLWATVAGSYNQQIDTADCHLFDAATRTARQKAVACRANRRQIKNNGDVAAYAAAKLQELAAERAVATAAPDPTTVGQLQATVPLAKLITANLTILAKALNPGISQQCIEKLGKILSSHL
jgi:uncharacterized protein (TIGR02444 family)